MFHLLVVATAFEVDEAHLVAIASAAQILLHGELPHQVGLLRKFLPEGSHLPVGQPHRRHLQFHQVQRHPFLQAHLEGFQQAHEQEFLVHPFSILPAFIMLVRMRHCPIIQAHVLIPQWPIFRKSYLVVESTLQLQVFQATSQHD
jgi:hypothetical protein